MRFALVSREVYPFVGGGLSRYVTATAETLSGLGEVTVFTSAAYQARFFELRSADFPDFLAGVKFVFVPEPNHQDVGSYYHFLHLWSASVYEALKREYAANGPDLIEFPDYHGEAFVTIQARRALEPIFRNTSVCVRLYTTSEMASVLNGYVPGDFASTVVFDMERYAIRYADHILEPGGDIYDTYLRFLGRDQVAPATRVRHPVLHERPPGKRLVPHTDEALRLLYVGRLERRKGVQNLVRALTAIPRDDWTITLVGGDTPTAPLGTSMRAQLELSAGGDHRIRFEETGDPRRIASLMDESDIVVMPSLWECWPNVALEAFARSTPVLATPTGGFVELVQPGRSGWLTRDTSVKSLVRSLEQLVESKTEVRELAASESPRRLHERLTNPDEVRETYARLVEAQVRTSNRRKAPPETNPLVSVVVPYFQLDKYVEATLQSIREQTYPLIETIVVNDGSFREADLILERLAERYPIRILTQQNSGLGAARNFGIAQSKGRYVLPLDADDLVAPTFVERCVEILEAEPQLAYATSWSRFIDDAGEDIGGLAAGYQPLGICRALKIFNVAGSAEAVFRKRIFELGLWYSIDLTSYEDWFHFRRIAAAGYGGYVIPERQLSYRIRDQSMLRTIGINRHDWLVAEMAAHLIEAGTPWMPLSA
jgi:glycogen synthase